MSKEQVITGHRLEVIVEEAREIKATNFFSSTESDVFCELSVLDGVIKKTEVQFKTLTPSWNEKFTFELSAIPEGEVLFVNVWGRHVVSKNTFIGRVEVPLTLIIEPLVFESDTISYKESTPVSRWFKLLPVAGSNAWDQAPGFVRLTLQYKYVPEVVPTRAVPPTPEITLATPATQQPPNTTLCYQCPVCSQLFMPEVIMSHMQSCATGAAQPQQQQQQQVFAPTVKQQQVQQSVYQMQQPQQIVIGQQKQQEQQQQFQSQQVLPSAPQYSCSVPPSMTQQQQQQGYPYISTVGVQVFPPGVVGSSSIQTQQQQQAPALPASPPPYLNQNYLVQPTSNSTTTTYMMSLPSPPPSCNSGISRENCQYYGVTASQMSDRTMIGAQ